MKVSLNGEWKLSSKILKNSLTVTVPGSVINDLFINGIIEEPYYRDNDEKILSYMDNAFIYERDFEIKDNDLNNRINLCFMGLDTVSDVYLNDKLILSSHNMHRRFELNINNSLLIGKNHLKVILKSSLEFIKNESKKTTHGFMQMSYSVPGYIHIRKAHAMYGWDWGPQMPDAGIWRDVYLEIIEKAKIENVEVRQKTTSSLSKVEVNVKNYKIDDKAKVIVTISKDEFRIIKEDNIKELNEFSFEITNPKLWNVNGYGEQHLYLMNVKIVKDNIIIDEYQEKIGLRDIKIQREIDQYGTSFTVIVNDQKIFVKGSDYIIEDSILPRSNDERTKFLLNSAAECYQNTIRVWGGALYPKNYFYELCDELGLLVWQDLMFACGYYNMENDDFVNEIKEEIIDNLKRIRNHACLLLVCGNNENEKAVEWGIPDIEYTKKWYLYQYEDLIPKIVKEVVPDIFYWPSSPSSGGGFDKPDDDSRGDMHYWGVWHNNEPIENYRHQFPRMMSEFGMQSFPSMKTIQSFSKEEDLNITSYVMERHQKNTNSNLRIMYYIGMMFKYPKEFEDIVYLSQIVQAKAFKYCVEHLRRNYGRCMGSIYWQLNDCWPVISWSTIDYYNRFKASQYFSKKFYAPILLSIEENMNDSTAIISCTNETKNDLFGKVEWKLCDFFGNVIKKGDEVASVNSFSVNKLIDLKFKLTKEEKRNYFLYVKYITNNGCFTSEVNFEHEKFLNLVKPNINYELIKNNDEYQLKLISNTYAMYVEVEAKNIDLYLSDNYFNLYPNEEKIVTFKSKEKISKEDLCIRTLVDCE